MHSPEIIPVVHNVSSVPRMVEYARIAIGFGFKTVVYSRVFGSAAQQGIGEVFKMALRHNSSILILPDIGDVIELLKPDTALFIARPGKGATRFSTGMIRGRTIIVANGSDMPFIEEDVRGKGALVYAEDADIGSLGQFAILLNDIRKGI